MANHKSEELITDISSEMLKPLHHFGQCNMKHIFSPTSPVLTLVHLQDKEILSTIVFNHANIIHVISVDIDFHLNLFQMKQQFKLLAVLVYLQFFSQYTPVKGIHISD